MLLLVTCTSAVLRARFHTILYMHRRHLKRFWVHEILHTKNIIYEALMVPWLERSCSFLNKPITVNLAFPSLYHHTKNQFIPLLSFYNTVSLRILGPEWPNPIFDHTHTDILLSTFNFHEFVSTCKKSGYFIILFKIYIWLRNPAIWLAKGIWVHISGTRFCPNKGFVQEYSV